MNKIEILANEIGYLNPEELADLCSTLNGKHNMFANIYRYRYSINEYDGLEKCSLVLKETGPYKLRLVKEIKDVFDIGLKYAKDIVDSVPCKFEEPMSRDTAKTIKSRLEEVGATLEIWSI